MRYVNFDPSRPLDLVLLGRVAIDLNPVDYYQPLTQCTTFQKYVGGSPANIAVGLSRLGKKCGFLGRVSDDRSATSASSFFQQEAWTPPTSAGLSTARSWT